MSDLRSPWGPAGRKKGRSNSNLKKTLRGSATSVQALGLPEAQEGDPRLRGRQGRKTRTCEFPERQGQGRTRLRARTSSQCPLGADQRGRVHPRVWERRRKRVQRVGAEPTRIEEFGGVPGVVGQLFGVG